MYLNIIIMYYSKVQTTQKIRVPCLIYSIKILRHVSVIIHIMKTIFWNMFHKDKSNISLWFIKLQEVDSKEVNAY